MHPRQFRGGLQWLVAVGADRDRHDQGRGHANLVLHQRGQHLQKAWGLRSGIGVEQFLSLIHWQHQGGGGLIGGYIQLPGACNLAGLLQPAPQIVDLFGVAGFLDLPRHRVRQPQVSPQLMNGVGEAEFTGEHRAFGAHDIHSEEAAVVAT